MKNTICLILSALLLAVCSAARAADPIGMVVSIQGSATAAGEAGASRALETKSAIFLNDTVTTGAGSKLQIMFNDDSIFAQGENSEMTIDEYIFNPAEQKDNAFGVRLGQGMFRTVTGKITDLNPDRFAVKTARATIGIRGCDLGFTITPSEDNIAVVTVPVGKTIFVDPVQGGPGATLTTPTLVVVNDSGNLNTRPLTAEDRTQVQQGTTPENTTSTTDNTASSDATGDTTVETTATDGTSSGDTTGDSGGTVLDTGTVVQDTNQQLTEHILSQAEIESIIAGSTAYFLQGDGTATATIHTYAGATPLNNYTVSGPAHVDMEIGNGIGMFTLQAGLLDNASSQTLEFQTGSVDMQNNTDLAIGNTSDITSLSMHADGTTWSQTDLTDVAIAGTLYGTGGNAAPTAGQLGGDGNEMSFQEVGGVSAIVDFSTTKVQLNSQMP